MAKLNENYRKLQAGYLFPEIARRVNLYQQQNPEKRIHRLGIGNTTEPLTPTVAAGLREGAERLARTETYRGYGDEQGDEELRQALVKFYGRRGVSLQPDEFFVSDGAKCDAGNIQSIFSVDNRVAVQDPAYPVYVDTNVISGRSGPYNPELGNYAGLIYMVCSRENNFVPEPPKEDADLIYICNPNNPTGAVATREELKRFTDYARERKAVLIYDAAYAEFISDPRLPRSIYEVEGARECAIEINSFSKLAGFTGVRLGFTIVPKALVSSGSEAGEIHGLWLRRQTTFFNGASNIAQRGGLAALTEEGLRECAELVWYYMENARVISEGLTSAGLDFYGGINAPYLWVKTPGGLSSWGFFDKMLQEAQIVGTPGSGFGPSGEGYFRLSAFGHRSGIEEAVDSMKRNLKLS